MKTILLAAGQSKRVKPIADKCFVKICGKTLIEWQLEALKKAKFTDVVLVGNAANVKRLKELQIKGMRLAVVEQVDLKGGMKGAMMAAKMAVIGEDAILVVSSNDVVDQELWAKVRMAVDEDDEAEGMMVGYRVSRYFPGGYLSIDSDGNVKAVLEKPGEGKEPSDLVNLVIHVHRDVKALYKALEAVKSRADDQYERALQKLFDTHHRYTVIPYDGFWQAVKYPWNFLRLNEFFLGQLKKSISPKSTVAKTAVINGPVVIEAGVKVFDHAVINGPAYIGKDSIVGNHALVRQSSLGERCVAGSYTEVARSLLQNEVWTHKNYLGDSVIGSNVSFGSGTVTGNLRLDEADIWMQIDGDKVNSRTNKLGLICGDDVRVGINTSFMPGVKVGRNCMIGAELSVGQDIPEGSYVKKGNASTGSASPSGLEVRENERVVGRRG
ncbi:MAG: sugar phosphate nucleotidyltransferase [bacterium]|nr:sugar phosphate nucleotidyltransferase [bacterium]